MIFKNNSQKGFTIVELLIVIVVIGILAAISIVAYNGIQNRARDTAVKNSASQVRTKIESWNSIKGSYPTQAQILGGLVDAATPETRIDPEVASKITDTSGTIPADTSEGSKLMYASRCVASGETTGYRIYYSQSPAGPNPSVVAGVC